MPDPLASTLAGVQQRADAAAAMDIDVLAAFNGVSVGGVIAASAVDVPLLLAAIEAILKDHRKSMFPAGPPGAADAYGKHYCAGICYTSVDQQAIYRVWPCQPYQDIARALLGEE